MSDKVLEHIIEMKSTLGSVEEHLRNLNSKVASQEVRIHELDGDVERVKLKLVKYAAIMATVIVIAELAIKFIV